jgi:uncharacterized membrane protein (DUF441 family)
MLQEVQSMDQINLVLLAILAIGIIGNNQSVSISVAVLLLVRLLGFHSLFPYLEKYGLQAGIVILTIGVLAPLASGKVPIEEMVRVVKSPPTLLALLIGIIVAYLGGRGVHLLGSNPLMVTSIMMGTIIGVAFLRGVPVGPLIAAGMTSFILSLFHKV